MIKDNCFCCNCEHRVFVDVGTEECPVCHYVGALSWFDDTEKEVDVNCHDNLAKKFCDAIKTMASKPENLDNFELYLTYHFPEWMKKYANDPESLVAEFVDFATMDIGDMDSRGNGDA